MSLLDGPPTAAENAQPPTYIIKPGPPGVGLLVRIAFHCRESPTPLALDLRYRVLFTGPAWGEGGKLTSLVLDGGGLGGSDLLAFILRWTGRGEVICKLRSYSGQSALDAKVHLAPPARRRLLLGAWHHVRQVMVISMRPPPGGGQSLITVKAQAFLDDEPFATGTAEVSVGLAESGLGLGAIFAAIAARRRDSCDRERGRPPETEAPTLLQVKDIKLWGSEGIESGRTPSGKPCSSLADISNREQ